MIAITINHNCLLFKLILDCICQPIGIRASIFIGYNIYKNIYENMILLIEMNIVYGNVPIAKKLKFF